MAAQSAALTTVITDMAAEKTMYMAYLTTTVAKRLEVEPHYSNDLEVWRNLKTEGKVQRASQKARVLLAIQATQIASERVFNRVKAITGTRASLHSSRLERFVLATMNMTVLEASTRGTGSQQQRRRRRGRPWMTGMRRRRAPIASLGAWGSVCHLVSPRRHVQQVTGRGRGV